MPCVSSGKNPARRPFLEEGRFREGPATLTARRHRPHIGDLTMLKPIALGLGLLTLPTLALAQSAPVPNPPAQQPAAQAAAPAAVDAAHSAPRVQIALLLDTSSSMDGLIDQAR